MTKTNNERREMLAAFLRARRSQLSPEAVGLPRGRRRRTPGLRREEVAERASIGVAWYTALEQAREVQPSVEVLFGVARALQLSEAERAYLLQLAQPAMGDEPLAPEERLPQSLRRLIDAHDPLPAYLHTACWDVLIWNRSAELVFGFSSGPAPHPHNLLWRFFMTPGLPERSEGWERKARHFVAQARQRSAERPDARRLPQVLSDLQTASPVFAAWWSANEVAGPHECAKRIHHASLGLVELEEVTLQTTDEFGQRVVLYQADEMTVTRIQRALAQAVETKRASGQAP